MTEVHHRPPGGKGGDPSSARLCLRRFVAAALALDAAWHPVLDGPTYPRYLPSFDQFVRDLQDWQEEAEDRPYTDLGEIKPLNVTDPAALRAWLAELRIQVDDAVAAGEDATRPPGQRDLGRAMARRKLLAARGAIQQLIEAAERGAAIPAPG
jgi:hypothetical protein